MKKYIYSEVLRNLYDIVEQEAVACHDCAVVNKLAHAPHLDTYLVECDSNFECEFHEEDFSRG